MKNHERPPVDFVTHYRAIFEHERVQNAKRRRALEELAARACTHCAMGACVHGIARHAIDAWTEVVALRKIAERKCEACDGRHVPEVNGKCAHVVAREALK